MFARPMRRLRLISLTALLVAPLLLVGCKGQCRQLSEKLCECAATTLERDDCLRRASTEEARAMPTAEQEAFCAELLPKCDCHAIDTAEGKRNCGLAR